jgi:hypothetical protein
MNIKTQISLFILAVFHYSAIYSQAVKFIKNPVTAKYRVFITAKPAEATVFVYRVSKYQEAIGAGLWYIVENPTLFKEAMTLFEVHKKEEADLIVYYTKNKDNAGYKFKNK